MGKVGKKFLVGRIGVEGLHSQSLGEWFDWTCTSRVLGVEDTLSKLYVWHGTNPYPKSVGTSRYIYSKRAVPTMRRMLDIIIARQFG